MYANVPLGKTIHIDAVTHDPTTGGRSNATGTTFEVYEENSDTPILTGQTLTLRSGQTGNYRGSVAFTTGNTVEVDKTYNVIGQATVGGVTGQAVLARVRIVAEETVAGVPEVDVTHFVGELAPAPAITGIPDVNMTHHVDVAASITNSELDVNVGQIVGTVPVLSAGSIDVNVVLMDANSIAAGTIAAGELTNIEDEIWDALKSAHTTPNSFGDFIDIEVSSRLASADIGLTGGAVDLVTTVTNVHADSDLTATIAELSVTQPATTPTVRTGLMLLYMMTRNQFITQTSGTDAIEVYNDAGTLITSKLIDDTTGDYTEAKMT